MSCMCFMERIAIVTGASRGIGREIAVMLAHEGVKVIANYNNSESMALELQDSLKNEGFFIDIFKADVSKRLDVQALVSYTLEKYGHIDILVNNAGISKSHLITDVSDEEWNDLINVNLYSVFAMSQEVCKSMINNKSGCIINISSIWGMVGASMESIYSVTKAGIDALTKSLAKELGPSNIRVNSIAPGIIDTDMNAEWSDSELNDIKENIPLGSIGMPNDIAKCVKWLIDDSYTTGQVISVNGGWVI